MYDSGKEKKYKENLARKNKSSVLTEINPGCEHHVRHNSSLTLAHFLNIYYPAVYFSSPVLRSSLVFLNKSSSRPSCPLYISAGGEDRANLEE
nr:hypothetical protein HmN_000386100 [Hymenolepis microstoma]